MDVLSDVIGVMRTGRAHSARAERAGRWAVRHPQFPGAGFHVVLHGTCRLVPPDGQAITLGAGDAVLLPHGSAHAMTGGHSSLPARTPLSELTDLDDQELEDDGADVVMLCGAYLMAASRPHPLITQLPDVIHLPAHLGRRTTLHTALDLLAAELQQRRPGADATVSALLDALLVYMVRSWLEDHPGDHRAAGWPAALQDPAIHAALRGIHGDPARPWTVAELGALAGLSRAAFARRFTTLVGRPPLTYLTWWRMTLAAQHLRGTDTPLAAVAARIGYTSPFAFATAFKREYGTAPGAYRNTPSRYEP